MRRNMTRMTLANIPGGRMAAWVVACLAALGLGFADLPGGLAQGAQPRALTIQQVRTARPMRGGPPVAVQGYYHNDQVPLLLDNLDLLRVNTVMPKDRYIVLRGKLPANLKEGSRVEVLGAPVAANTQSVLLVLVSDHGGGFLYPAVGQLAAGMYGGMLDRDDRDADDQVSESKVMVDVDGDGSMSSVVGVHQTVILWGESMSDSQFA